MHVVTFGVDFASLCCVVLRSPMLLQIIGPWQVLPLERLACCITSKKMLRCSTPFLYLAIMILLTPCKRHWCWSSKSPSELCETHDALGILQQENTLEGNPANQWTPVGSSSQEADLGEVLTSHWICARKSRVQLMSSIHGVHVIRAWLVRPSLFYLFGASGIASVTSQTRPYYQGESEKETL